MDLLDRLLGHDSWTTRQLLVLSHTLTDNQLDHEFDIGHRTVRATFVHIIRNMEVWTDLMAGNPVRAPQGKSITDLLQRLDRAAGDLAQVAKTVAQRGAWDDCFIDTLDNPNTKKSVGGGIAHIISHSMHHRAQLIHMLHRLGVQGVPEGDALSWENQNSRENHAVRTNAISI